MKNKLFIGLTVALASLGQAANFVNVNDIPGNVVRTNGPLAGKVTVINTDQRWTADNVYILNNLTFIEAPAVLTIEPGTIIRGEKSTTGGNGKLDPANPGSLIITRGAKINANGTSETPIIMTSIDDPNVPGGRSTVPSSQNNNVGDQPNPDRYDGYGAHSIDSQFGGLIILGKARVAIGSANASGTPDSSVGAPSVASNGDITKGKGSNFIEGFQAIDGSDYGIPPRTGYSFSGGVYGGTEDEDNSGVVRFVSIRYGGFILSPNNEINGLTTGGVGHGTTFEFIEVFNNADDCFEHFGGIVDQKYVASLFGGDDSFDYDEGYRGRTQFALTIQNNVATGSRGTGSSSTGRNAANVGDNVGEFDGPDGATSLPQSVFTMANWSGIGEGTLGSVSGYPTAKQGGPNFKDKSGGRVINTIFTEVNATDSAYLINPNTLARWTTTRTNGGFAGISHGPASDKDGFIRYTTFTMDKPSNDVVKDGTNNPTSITDVVNVDTGNIFDATKDDAVFVNTGRLSNLDPRLKANVVERTNGVNPRNYLSDTWFTSTDFRGAMRDNNWLAGWSILETLGVFASTANVTQPQVNLSVANGKTYVTFYAEDGIRYSIETSQKNVRYTSLESITGAGANVTREISPTTGKLYVRILPL
jgi:hypothetical protein